MFYRQHKTFWYQFCNLKHFLKAKNSENIFASSCEQNSVTCHVTQSETELLLELLYICAMISALSWRQIIARIFRANVKPFTVRIISFTFYSNTSALAAPHQKLRAHCTKSAIWRLLGKVPQHTRDLSARSSVLTWLY